MLNISKLKLNNNDNKFIINKGELNNDIYHPSLTKEWINSIYHYYKNNEKNIPNLDLLVIKAISNYFTMYSSQLERSIFLRKKSIKRRRYQLNKILVSKPEFKHTNDKVKITLYIYNPELFFLNLKMKNLKKRILAQYFYKIFTTKYITINKLYLVKSLIKRVNLLKSHVKNLKLLRNKYLSRFSIIDNNILIAKNTIKTYYKEWFYLKDLTSYMYRRRLLRVGKNLNRFEKNARKIRNLFKRKINKGFDKKINNSKLLHNYVQVKVLSKSIKIIKFLSVLFNKLDNNTHKNTINLYNEQVNDMPFFSISKKAFVNKIRKMIFRLKLLFRYNKTITFNKLKFSSFLAPLKFFLERVYKKDVEFDIVTLKNYRLNSSILTQIIAIKLKNKKNLLLRTIKKIYFKIKLPINKKHHYLKNISINKFRQNIILRKLLNKNFIYNKPLMNVNILEKNISKKNIPQIDRLSYGLYKGDRLNLLLKSVYKNQNTLINKNILNVLENIDINKKVSDKLFLERNIENIALDSIKNKSITGIKLKVSGRLNKKIAGARSTYIIKQKGTIKNINSSYKKLSSLLLRGNLSSNLQYTIINNNKTRIGSFGLKGWISSI